MPNSSDLLGYGQGASLGPVTLSYYNFKTLEA